MRMGSTKSLSHLGDGSMVAAFDIFRKDLLGTPVWMEAVPDLETAKRRMTELVSQSPAEYFVYSQTSQEIVGDTAPRLPEFAI
jgi:hypothetical protein